MTLEKQNKNTLCTKQKYEVHREDAHLGGDVDLRGNCLLGDPPHHCKRPQQHHHQQQHPQQ